MKRLATVLVLAIVAVVGLFASFWPQFQREREDKRQLWIRRRVCAIACTSNMKQIGLAVRLYAMDHSNCFPQSLMALTNEMKSPVFLFCCAASNGFRTMNWLELDAATITYRYLNPGGNESDPRKPLTECPIHGHIGLSDGSVTFGEKSSRDTRP